MTQCERLRLLAGASGSTGETGASGQTGLTGGLRVLPLNEVYSVVVSHQSFAVEGEACDTM